MMSLAYLPCACVKIGCLWLSPDCCWRCLALRPLNRHFQKVDSGDLAPLPGKEQGRVPGAAGGVEDSAADLVGHVDEGLLRLADVPGRLAGVGTLKRAAVGIMAALQTVRQWLFYPHGQGERDARESRSRSWTR